MQKSQRHWLNMLRLASFALGLVILTVGSAVAQNTNRFVGILTAIWGDPRPGGSGGSVRFELTSPDGTKHPLLISGAKQSEATQYVGKPVTVDGSLTNNAALGPSTIVVNQIAPAASPNNAPMQPQAVIGTRKALFLLLKFKGDAQQPHAISFYTALTNPLTPAASTHTPTTINGFFHAVSYGKLKFAAVVGGNKWFTLPRTKAQYAPCNNFSATCANIDLIAQDALTLATNAGINITAYSVINFVLNNDLDCCAWGGTTVFNGKVYSATWEPPWAQHAETYVHELGHSIGLPHSGWRYYSYDSPWDIMSMHNQLNLMNCGSYTSVNDGNKMDTIFCPEPGSGYIMAHKNWLGWVPLANQITINAKGTKTVNLINGATALGTTIKMITICLPSIACTGASAHFLTVEVKTNTVQFDRGAPNNGVIIHDVLMNRGSIGGGCFFNNQSGWAIPIDAKPRDFNSTTCSPESSQGSASGGAGLGNAEFLPGKTYTDTVHGITIKVVKAIANGYQVTVTRSK
jgi:gametolysin peptidase M11